MNEATGTTSAAALYAEWERARDDRRAHIGSSPHVWQAMKTRERLAWKAYWKAHQAVTPWKDDTYRATASPTIEAQPSRTGRDYLVTVPVVLMHRVVVPAASPEQALEVAKQETCVDDGGHALWEVATVEHWPRWEHG